MALGEGADIAHILAALERGTVMTRFLSRKKANWMFYLRTDTFEVLQYAHPEKRKHVAPKESIDIREIREIREGINSKDFERSLKELKKIDPQCCFIVYYGMEFQLKSLSVVALCRDDCVAWVKALKHLTHPSNFRSHLLTQRWLNKEFQSLDQTHRGMISRADLKRFMEKISSKTLQSQIKQLFADFDCSKSRYLGIEEFYNLYHSIIHVRNIGEKFYPYCLDKQNLTFPELQVFFKEEQQDKRADDTSYIASLVCDFVQQPGKSQDADQPSLTLPEFVSFLFSKRNSIFNDECGMVYQNMDRPLSHYWIASSHNTYLTGNQYSSESSVEAYVQVLRAGCRCIELDTWDGPDGQPIIYHGHTLTSKIRFMDVLKAIKENAFVASEYPLIITVEQHCDLPQQRFMARAFKEYLGDMLLLQPVDASATSLPTPNQLKKKIIIKHKKLTISDKEKEELDLRNSIKKGYLFIQDPIDKMWEKHHFVLTTDKLFFAKEPEEDKPKPCVVRALCEYTAMKSDELSFCKDAIITNVERVNSSRWKGDYGRRKGRWFPAKYVKEIDISHLVDEEREQGSLKHQVIDITGCMVEMQNVPRSSMYMLRILSKTSGDSIVTPVLEVAADSSKEIIEWHHTIENQQMKAVMQSKKVSTVEQAMEQQEQRKRIAKELSDLVICFYSVPFAFEHVGSGKYYQMSSFMETRLERIVRNKHQAALFVVYSKCHLSRVYPKVQRMDSSNYDPLCMWNAGSQMVALNYQAGDKGMHLNEGRFLQNGRCGYILKPECMFEPGFNPVDSTTHRTTPITLHVEIIGARHLLQNCNVEVKVCGIEADWGKFRTSMIKGNGFNPVWNEGCEFDILNPDLALLRFEALNDEDLNLIGQAVFPVPCIRTGFRSIPLKNAWNKELELSALLVYVEIRRTDAEDEQIYSKMRYSSDEAQGKLDQQEEEQHSVVGKSRGPVLESKYGNDETQAEVSQDGTVKPDSLPVIAHNDLGFLDRLGEGGSGIVYRGLWKSMNKVVAIKKVDNIDERELEILGSLHHPNFIHLYGAVKQMPWYCLVTELAENGSVYDYLHNKKENPSLEQSLLWAKQIAQGMNYLHQRNIIHRDLKSSNVVLSSDMTAKICDLGSARILEHTTHQTTAVGTYAWMAPEMMQREEVSKKCDVYSYSILLWEMITHKPPFCDELPLMIPMLVIQGKRPPVPDCDVYLQQLMKQCWRDKPKPHDHLKSLVQKGWNGQALNQFCLCWITKNLREEKYP